MAAGFLYDFVLERLPELWLRTGEHLMLTGVSTGAAIILGVPLGILASRVARLRGPLLGATGILQTIPSLAMLAILLAVTGKIGVLPAIIALILYSLLPIMRNTLTGIQGVSPASLEAARGIGMTNRQQLWMIKIPLALPVIVAGIRTAAVTGVGIATLSAFIGAGGLGQFINRGLALANNDLVLLGAIPAALLALIVDFSIATMLWSVQPRKHRHLSPRRRAALRGLAFSFPFLIGIGGAIAYVSGSAFGPLSPSGLSNGDRGPKPVVIASKNFTEQFILGELMAQLIEEKTGLAMLRRFNLGGTMICHGALVNGEIDMYAEYTGTGLTAVLKKPVLSNPDKALNIVAREYRQRFDVEWLKPFGFNNTYAITVRQEDARLHGWEKISDLTAVASSLRAGFTSEFAERSDGYPGLVKTYGLHFGKVRDLDPSLMYEGLVREEVDLICAFATDGRIAAYRLKPLVDDLHFFPPYHAAPVIRGQTLRAHPEIRQVLAQLSGLLDDTTMQRLNYEVDAEKRTPREVAREFLKFHNLLNDDQ
ncbi:MAG: ABC transporter permease subunit [Deltaproteobacteria bacterium]|nr:ABC transporter permease subunit [Deltaproteobacteria bacterium]